MQILAIKRAAPGGKANGLDLPVREILGRLAARHDVTLASWGGQAPAPRELNFRTTVRPLPAANAQTRGNSGNRRELRLLDHYGFAAETVPWLASLMADYRPDVVVGIDYATLPALAGNRAVPRLAYLLDNRFLSARQELRTGNRSRAAALKELVWSWRLHRRYGRSADAFIFVTEQEAAGFRRFTRRPCWVITNGVDVERFRPSGAARDTNTVVFVGSLDFPPNIEATAWFCEQVWPHVRRACPDARFQIVGRDPVPRVAALAGREQIEVISDPPDIRPYLARAAVAVAPMRSGGGVKNKILEGWAMGTPMVVTRMSLAGLAARPGDNILAADRPADFAANLVLCLRDTSLRDLLAARGRETVLAEHTWEKAAAQFEECLAAVINVDECQLPEAKSDCRFATFINR